LTRVGILIEALVPSRRDGRSLEASIELVIQPLPGFDAVQRAIRKIGVSTLRDVEGTRQDGFLDHGSVPEIRRPTEMSAPLRRLHDPLPVHRPSRSPADSPTLGKGFAAVGNIVAFT